MKKGFVALALIMTVFLTWAGSVWSIGPVQNDGSWEGASQVDSCTELGLYCAEWYAPGSSMDGRLCCIEFADLSSGDYGACIHWLNGPREDPDYL